MVKTIISVLCEATGALKEIDFCIGFGATLGSESAEAVDTVFFPFAVHVYLGVHHYNRLRQWFHGDFQRLRERERD